jgi:sugar (pentulose or hexulose) kinase
LHPDELKKIEMVVKETQGMDPGTAALYSRASRLPAKDYLDLLDVMNNSERAALAPLTLKTQKKYLNKAKKDETPEERAKDPVFQRFLNMVPGQHPGPISQAAPPIPAPVQQEAAHLYRAINPSTGHRIVHDGSQWRDAETGVAV